jgi:uncharacterized protein
MGDQFSEMRMRDQKFMKRRQALTHGSLLAGSIFVPAVSQAQSSAAGKRIAVLLPPSSGEFRRATSSILAGIKAALSRDGGGSTIDTFWVDERFDSLANTYQEISAKGYAFAIGPLIKSSVTQLADLPHLNVPTLTLNWPDNDRSIAGNTVFFGLPIESDSVFIAKVAFADASSQSTRRPLRACIINNTSPLGRRAATAFSQGWTEQGAQLADQVETDSKLTGEMRSLLGQVDADVFFVASTLETARAVKLALPKDSLLYGPSMLSTGITATNLNQSAQMRTPELDGYRVTDLPWLIQADHPAVMAYPKQSTLSHQELQRLYALGIDAFRIARELMTGSTSFDLDGVSGRLRYDRSVDAKVQRSPVLAEYRGGLLVPLERR